MITPYKNRTVNATKPVLVYRNLHRGGYSIKQCGLVVGHCEQLTLSKCKLIVSESGRQRVIKNKQKNVHAFVSGYVCSEHVLTNELTYNPYRFSSFVDKGSLEPVLVCNFATLTTNGVSYE